MNIKNIYRKGAGSVCCGIAVSLMALPVLTSCEDFFARESDDVLYAVKRIMSNVYSENLPLDEEKLRKAVSDTGYTLISVTSETAVKKRLFGK